MFKVNVGNIQKEFSGFSEAFRFFWEETIKLAEQMVGVSVVEDYCWIEMKDRGLIATFFRLKLIAFQAGLLVLSNHRLILADPLPEIGEDKVTGLFQKNQTEEFISLVKEVGKSVAEVSDILKEGEFLPFIVSES